MFLMVLKYLHEKHAKIVFAALPHCSYLMFMLADIVRSSFAISEKAGLDSGSDDQHLSISDFQAGSHQLGISGRRLPLIMPAEDIKNFKDYHQITIK